MIITKIKDVSPTILLTKPINPRSRWGAMEFEKELLE
jgi:hypothetical protein